MRPDLRRLIRPHPNGCGAHATALAHYRLGSDVESGADHVRPRRTKEKGLSDGGRYTRPRPSWKGGTQTMVGEMVVGGGGMTISG